MAQPWKILDSYQNIHGPFFSSFTFPHSDWGQDSYPEENFINSSNRDCSQTDSAHIPSSTSVKWSNSENKWKCEATNLLWNHELVPHHYQIQQSLHRSVKTTRLSSKGNLRCLGKPWIVDSPANVFISSTEGFNSSMCFFVLSPSLSPSLVACL